MKKTKIMSKFMKIMIKFKKMKLKIMCTMNKIAWSAFTKSTKEN